MNRQRALLTVLATALLALPLATLAADDAKKADDDKIENDNIQKAGKRLAPVPLNLKGKKKDLVYRGSYIVNAQGGCNDCHTNPAFAPGGDPFAGEPKQINATNYLAGGVAFGPFVSRNLTPDADGKPAGLTLDEFIHVMRTGEDLKHIPPADLLQVMPWPIYAEMNDKDLKAIYEYLRAIPHAEPGP